MWKSTLYGTSVCLQVQIVSGLSLSLSQSWSHDIYSLRASQRKRVYFFLGLNCYRLLTGVSPVLTSSVCRQGSGTGHYGIVKGHKDLHVDETQSLWLLTNQ